MAPQKSNDSTKRIKIKSKNMMYEQQLGQLPFSLAELEARIKRLNPVRYALVMHDKDTHKDGTPVEPHVHVMLCFKNARYLDSVAKKLDNKPQQIKEWDERANNGFSYLLHITNGASSKAQYAPSQVVANFDFRALVEKEIPGQIAANHDKKAGTVKTLLDMMYVGLKTKREIEAELSGSLYGRYRSQIEAVWAKRLQIMAADWRKEKLAEGAQVRVIWIYGPAGTGKTSMAKAYAQKAGQEYYISGSSRDIFQGYGGEHTLIMDELRPRAIPYHDLLRILDPFSLTDPTMAPARYSDKAIACDLIIITTPFDPLSFYKKEFGSDSDVNRVDSFDQLLRRLTLIMYMTDDVMEAVTYNFYGFQFIPETVVRNPYSAKNRPAPKVNGLDLYRSMLDSAAPLTGQEKGGEDNDPGNIKKDQ